MFVFDFTNHLFNQVFDGDQPVNPAIFVDHHGHMTPFGLHFGQQDADRHGRGDKQQRAQQGGQIKILGLAVEPVLQRQILEVCHADRGVQCAVKDRQTCQPAFFEDGDQFLHGDADRHSCDFGLGDRYIVDPHPAQVHHATRRHPINGKRRHFRREIPLGRAECANDT